MFPGPRPLTELGLLAYGLYLFHQMVIGVVFGVAGKEIPSFKNLPTVGLTLLSGFLVFMLARFSWLYLEKPLVNRGHHYKYRHALAPALVDVPVAVGLSVHPILNRVVENS